MDKYENVNYFVTSYLPECILQAKEQYGDRVLVKKPRVIKGSRDSVEGMQDILIDQLLCSRNKLLIGSRRSTFAKMIWWWGRCKTGIDLVNC